MNMLKNNKHYLKINIKNFNILTQFGHNLWKHISSVKLKLTFLICLNLYIHF